MWPDRKTNTNIRIGQNFAQGKSKIQKLLQFKKMEIFSGYFFTNIWEDGYLLYHKRTTVESANIRSSQNKIISVK